MNKGIEIVHGMIKQGKEQWEKLKGVMKEKEGMRKLRKGFEVHMMEKIDKENGHSKDQWEDRSEKEVGMRLKSMNAGSEEK